MGRPRERTESRRTSQVVRQLLQLSAKVRLSLHSPLFGKYHTTNFRGEQVKLHYSSLSILNSLLISRIVSLISLTNERNDCGFFALNSLSASASSVFFLVMSRSIFILRQWVSLILIRDIFSVSVHQHARQHTLQL